MVFSMKGVIAPYHGHRIFHLFYYIAVIITIQSTENFTHNYYSLANSIGMLSISALLFLSLQLNWRVATRKLRQV